MLRIPLGACCADMVTYYLLLRGGKTLGCGSGPRVEADWRAAPCGLGPAPPGGLDCGLLTGGPAGPLPRVLGVGFGAGDRAQGLELANVRSSSEPQLQPCFLCLSQCFRRF